jgi:AraC family transcriptional regulator
MDEDERLARGIRSVADGTGGQGVMPATPVDLSRLPLDPFAPAPIIRSWGGIVAARLDLALDELRMPAVPYHAILVNVGHPYRLEEELDGRRYRTSGVRGDVAVVPAGLSMSARSRERTSQRLGTFAVLLPPGFLDAVVAGGTVDPASVEIAGVLGARAPAVERIGLALLAELAEGGPMGEVYAESLATALAVQLLRNHSSRGRAIAVEVERRPAGGLSKSELRRITDYIESHIDRGLTLAGLAHEARLSPYHFARMFKLSTGRSPHRYVVERRVERARDLLVNTDLPLSEVALRAGFADQSHLAKQTRRFLGITPKELRRLGG